MLQTNIDDLILECKNIPKSQEAQGLAVIFSHHQVCINITDKKS